MEKNYEIVRLNLNKAFYFHSNEVITLDVEKMATSIWGNGLLR